MLFVDPNQSCGGSIMSIVDSANNPVSMFNVDIIVQNVSTGEWNAQFSPRGVPNPTELSLRLVLTANIDPN